MINFIIGAIKVIILLGFLVLIHEAGHFLVAKKCKVKVLEFSIGFGKEIKSKNGEETKKANLGISMTDIDNADYYSNGTYDDNQKTGVFIVGVNKGGPCDKAGIKPGDIIVKINGEDIKNIAELRYNLSKNNPGDKVKLTINRNTEIKEFEVTLSES